MIERTYSPKPLARTTDPDQGLRVLYVRDGKLAPRNTEGALHDSMPRTPAEGYTRVEAIEHAQWIVKNTLWSDGKALVQQRDFDGRYHTVYSVEC